MRRIVLISLLFALPGHGLLWAQKDQAAFFAGKGHADGLYEQAVHFVTDQDELDFWKDQRAYEYALLRQNPESYHFYLEAKQDVYAAHRTLCGPSCGHGDYYWLQASYYIQFGPESAPAYTNAGPPPSVTTHKQ